MNPGGGLGFRQRPCSHSAKLGAMKASGTIREIQVRAFAGKTMELFLWQASCAF